MPMNDGSFKNKMIQNFLKTTFLIPHLYMYFTNVVHIDHSLLH